MKLVSLVSITQNTSFMKKNFLFALAAILVLCYEPGCKKSDTNTPACDKAPVVSAGDDIVATGETTITLHGTSSGKTGTWSIVEGEGGKIETGTSSTLQECLKTRIN